VGVACTPLQSREHPASNEQAHGVVRALLVLVNMDLVVHCLRKRMVSMLDKNSLLAVSPKPSRTSDLKSRDSPRPPYRLYFLELRAL